ncbi:MAG TPA: hypothetical protein VEX86_11070, partial [Longimicrobium sp.]|nr:hypothetical protein [Longimicrobium sp.]
MTERKGDGGEGERPRAWERLSTRQVAEYEMFTVREEIARSPRDGAEQTFHVAESPGGVTVLAVTEGGELVMVEQYRHGPHRVTLELPSGMVD